MGLTRFQKYLSVSVALHLILLLGTLLTPQTAQINNSQVQFDFVENLPSTEVTAVDKSDAEKLQLVDQNEKALNDETPDKAKYLGAHNQVVKQQTIATNHGKFHNANQGGHNGDSTEQQIESHKKVEFKNFMPSMNATDTLKLAEQNRAEKSGMTDVERKRRLQAGKGNADPSQTLDYIKELEPGLETLLSTKEFKFHTYYSRIREQLSQHWEDLVKDRVAQIYRQGRQLASTDDKITKVLITLDSKGTLIRVQVIEHSGIHDLDEAAVDAFRAAAPFPNPPKGIVDPDGTIKIRWDFVLQA